VGAAQNSKVSKKIYSNAQFKVFATQLRSFCVATHHYLPLRRM